jgi:hypothetical protein
MNITLPTSPTKAIANPRSMIIYGAPKIGKTTAIAALPNALILDRDFKGGADFTDSMRIKIESYQHYEAVCMEILKKGRPYDYVICDTIDGLEELAWMQATIDYKASVLGKKFEGTDAVVDLPDGAGYYWLRKSLMRMVELTLLTANRVIFIGHIKDKYKPIDTGLLSTGEKGETKGVVGKEMDLTGKCVRMVSQRVDVIAHMTRRLRPRGNKPADLVAPKISDLWLDFRGDEDLIIGGRAKHLRGTEFIFNSPEQPDIFHWDKVFLPGVV